MVLTEKVRAKLAGGIQFALFAVTALAAGANNISAPAIGFNRITVAEFRPLIDSTISATTTSPAVMSTYEGETITISGVGGTGANAGSIRVYGY